MMIALAEVAQRWFGGHVCLYEVRFCADAPMLPICYRVHATAHNQAVLRGVLIAQQPCLQHYEKDRSWAFYWVVCW